MQTFLPLASFRQSAACLDNKRLGKQRVECKQILLALGVGVGAHEPYESRWRNHPAVLMWRDYETQLAAYAAVICKEWRSRGFRDNLLPEFMAAYTVLRSTAPHLPYPQWFGKQAFHSSHRSNLLRKNFGHYRQFGWQEPIDLPYVWPHETFVSVSPA